MEFRQVHTTQSLQEKFLNAIDMKNFIKRIRVYAGAWKLEEIIEVLERISKEEGFKAFRSIKFTHDEVPEIQVVYDYEKRK